MLKLNWKKISDWSIRDLSVLIEDSFFELNTTDIRRIKQYIQKKRIANQIFLDKWYDTFRDKKSIMYLAGQMLKRNYHLETGDWQIAPTEQYNAFWDFALRIVEYKNDQKGMSRRIRHRYLTKKK
jgi:hypothetical protein